MCSFLLYGRLFAKAQFEKLITYYGYNGRRHQAVK
jgi:hypothetical protein